VLAKYPNFGLFYFLQRYFIVSANAGSCYLMEKKITKEDIERVAQIARLSPSQDELEALTVDANAILEYFSLIDEIPESEKPQTYVLCHDNTLRKDEIKESEPKSIRRGFAKEQDNYMLAPKSF
ncbi:MAG: hypothetical protein WC408_04590, partial [Candidatus Micrarchaeia archaeon]